MINNFIASPSPVSQKQRCAEYLVCMLIFLIFLFMWTVGSDGSVFHQDILSPAVHTLRFMMSGKAAHSKRKPFLYPWQNLKFLCDRFIIWFFKDNGVPSILHAWVLGRFGLVQLFATLWTIALQSPLSIGFSRQECGSGLSCPSPGDLPHPGIEPCLLWLLQGRQILRATGVKPFQVSWTWKRSRSVLEWVAISLSRRSSPPRGRTQVSRIVDRRFTVWATREVQVSYWKSNSPRNLTPTDF